MTRTISAQILRDRWSHILFIRSFQKLFNDETVHLTRTVLLRMRFEGNINLDMWFKAQFPTLFSEYENRTRAIQEQYWTEWKNLQKRDPRVKSLSRDYIRQYHRHRTFLKPLEEARDKACIDVIAQILELPD